jgi:hypothetical protein
MKQFDSLQFDSARCREELAEFQNLLAAHPDLKESQDILPFFRARRHLSVFIGSRDPDISRFDRIAYEYDLFGDFTCDLVVGDSVTRTYGFIEFEDAAPGSLFVQRGVKATPEWAPRFEHGYSQIIDWFCKLDDMEKTDEFVDRFGGPTVKYFGLLVIGRNQSIGPREMRRLAWRQDRTVVNSQHIRCLTFDQLAEHLAERLKVYSLAARADD